MRHINISQMQGRRESHKNIAKSEDSRLASLEEEVSQLEKMQEEEEISNPVSRQRQVLYVS